MRDIYLRGGGMTDFGLQLDRIAQGAHRVGDRVGAGRFRSRTSADRRDLLRQLPGRADHRPGVHPGAGDLHPGRVRRDPDPRRRERLRIGRGRAAHGVHGDRVRAARDGAGGRGGEGQPRRPAAIVRRLPGRAGRGRGRGEDVRGRPGRRDQPHDDGGPARADRPPVDGRTRPHRGGPGHRWPPSATATPPPTRTPTAATAPGCRTSWTTGSPSRRSPG